MTTQEFQQIEKLLCNRIAETDYLKMNLSNYQYKKYRTFREGYLMCLIDIKRILEKEVEVSENSVSL